MAVWEVKSGPRATKNALVSLPCNPFSEIRAPILMKEIFLAGRAKKCRALLQGWPKGNIIGCRSSPCPNCHLGRPWGTESMGEGRQGWGGCRWASSFMIFLNSWVTHSFLASKQSGARGKLLQPMARGPHVTQDSFECGPAHLHTLP